MCDTVWAVPILPYLLEKQARKLKIYQIKCVSWNNENNFEKIVNHSVRRIYHFKKKFSFEL